MKFPVFFPGNREFGLTIVENNSLMPWRIRSALSTPLSKFGQHLYQPLGDILNAGPRNSVPLKARARKDFPPALGLLLEFQRRGIDAIALARRLRPVVE